MPQSSFSSGAILALVAGALSSPSPSAWASDGVARPPLIAQCRAWFDHVSTLMDQHRIRSEIDDVAFDAALRQFLSTRDACTMGDYATGLRLYEAFPLARVQMLLR